MVSDSSSDSRKVDKRTALALWDTSALPGGMRKKRADGADEQDSDQDEVMKFTLISKKGGKTQVCASWLVASNEAIPQTHCRVANFLSRRHQR
jgi:regulator of nonsense transcripts 2